MSQKFKKQQKKKRWSECGVVAPAWLTAKVGKLASGEDGSISPDLRNFGQQMAAFLGMRSTYAELDALKTLGPFVLRCAEDSVGAGSMEQGGDVECMLSMLSEVLFLDNSRPLHRSLLAQLKPLPEPWAEAFGRILCARVGELARQYLPEGLEGEGALLAGAGVGEKGALVQASGGGQMGAKGLAGRAGEDGQQQKRARTEAAAGTAGTAGAAGAALPSGVPLGQALTSLLSVPSLRPALAPAAAPAVACVATGVKAVLSGAAARTAADAGGAAGTAGEGAELHIPPAVMEDVQDSVSSLYYLLSGYGQELMESREGQQAVLLAADALLCALKGSALAREALSSAAAALYAAATLPAASPDAIALHFSQGLLLMNAAGAAGTAGTAGTECGSPAPKLVLKGGSLGALEGPSLSLVDSKLREGGSSLAKELQGLPAISKVCALKGLLYTMPLEVSCAELALVQPGSDASEAKTWVPLTDGALTMLGEAIRTAPDAHFKFHAARALAVTLDRIKEALAGASSHGAEALGGSGGAWGGGGKGADEGGPNEKQSQCSAIAGDETPDEAAGAVAGARRAAVATAGVLPMIGRGLREELKAVLWGAWDDPLGQTVKQVHASFGTLLDIQDLQATLAAQRSRQGAQAAQHGQQAAQQGQHAQQEEGGEDFLLGCARELLDMGPARKARYAPLAAVVARVGAGRLLQMQPHLPWRALEAMEDHVICSSVGAMLGALWEALRAECEAAAGGDKEAARVAWAAHWSPPMLAMLRSPNETLRANVATYALPPLLALDSGAMGHLLKELLADAHSAEGGAAGCVAVLKAGRTLQILTDLNAPRVAGLDEAAIEQILQRTVVHASESIRVDSLQLVCVHPKTTSLPTPLELRIVSKFVGLTLRCASTSMRNKFLAHMSKLLVRIRVGVAAALHRPATQRTPELMQAVTQQERWLQWFANTLQASLYPGAPFARTYMATELLNCLLDTFGDSIDPEQAPIALRAGSEARIPPEALSPFPPGFLSQALVDQLLVAAVDTWDKLREGALRALLRLPTPLPGLATGAAVEGLLRQALALVGSPRLGESDAGAKLVLLVYKKYVARLGWRISLAPRGPGLPPAVTVEPSLPPAAASTMELPSATAPNSEGNGTANDDNGTNGGGGRAGGGGSGGSRSGKGRPAGIQAKHEATLHFLDGACDLLEGSIEGGRQDMLAACRTSLAHGPQIVLRYLVGEVGWAQLAGHAQHAQRAGALVARLLRLIYQATELVLGPLSRPQEQNVGAEDVEADDVDLGDLAAAQLEGADGEGGDGTAGLGPKAQVIITGCWLTMKESSLLLGTLARSVPLTGSEGVPPLLSAAQLQEMGGHFVNALCLMKHNGAIDKTRAGFSALCERLLHEPSPALNTLPQQWLAAVLGFMQRPGQGRSDIVRRSAGLPYAIDALFVAEPGGSQKIIMGRGMAELLRLAGSETLPEPWPRVHALNALRVVYQDASLACDTSAYYAMGVEVSLLAMAAPQWEVRNAATLCYTSLLVRILGFRNTTTSGSAAKRAMTGADFFSQYPALHPFLLRQLSEATEALEGGAGPGAEGRGAMHPSLFPVLALLSRLRPSLHSRHGMLHVPGPSPAAFAPLVRRCAAANPLAVRQLAARALAPLLAPAELAGALCELAASIADALCGGKGHGNGGRSTTAGAGAAAGGEAGGRPHAPQPAANAVHGWLLQLRLLLEGAGADLSAAPEALAGALVDVSAQLRRCVGVCALGLYGCAPLSLEYVKTVRSLAALLAQQGTAQQAQHAALMRSVGQHCWAAIQRSLTVEDGDALNPMTSAAYKVAAELYFGPLWEGWQAAGEASPSGCTFVGDVEVALHSLKYEVRCAALKQLVKLLAPQHAQHGAHAHEAAAAAHAALDLPVLCAVLLRHLSSERHHKGVRRTLCLLSLLPPARSAGAAGEREDSSSSGGGGGGLFQNILQRAQHEADPAIKQYAVRCLGQLVRPLLLLAPEAPGLEQVGGRPLEVAAPLALGGAARSAADAAVDAAAAAVESFLVVIEDCSQPWQLPELRWAAVRALQSSGLLSARPRGSWLGASVSAGEAQSGGAGLPVWLLGAAVRGWAVAVRLLEEEDAEIREAMAEVAASAASAGIEGEGKDEGEAKGMAGSKANGEKEGSHSPKQQLQPLRQGAVEWVERGVFAMLPARFGAHPALLRLLCAWVWAPAPAGEGLETAGAVPEAEAAEAGAAEGAGGAAAAAAAAAAEGAPGQGPAGEGRRLFDRELDNHHEEPLLIAQLAANALVQLVPELTPSSEGAAAVQGWASLALDQLEASLGLSRGPSGGPGMGAGLEAVEGSALRMAWEQYGEVEGAVQEGVVPLYRTLLALWVAGQLPREEGRSLAEAAAGAAGGIQGAVEGMERGVLAKNQAFQGQSKGEQGVDESSGSGQPCSSWSEEIVGRLAALLGFEDGESGVGSALRQAQLGSIVDRVFEVWGYQRIYPGEPGEQQQQPAFAAAFLLGGCPVEA